MTSGEESNKHEEKKKYSERVGGGEGRVSGLRGWAQQGALQILNY